MNGKVEQYIYVMDVCMFFGYIFQYSPQILIIIYIITMIKPRRMNWAEFINFTRVIK